MKEKYSSRTIFKQKEYMKVLSANIINRFGDSIDAIALTWLIFQISHSPALSALNYGLNFIPSALFTPVAGAFVEKRNKKAILIISDIGRGSIVAIIAFCTAMNVLKPWMLLLSTFLISTFEAFRKPCGTVVITSLISKEMYADATALSNTLSQIAELIGTAAAALIIGSFGISSAILIDAATFYISAFLLCLTKIQEKNEITATSLSTLTQFKEGLAYMKVHPNVWICCSIAAMMNLAVVPFNSLQNVLVSQIYGMGSEILSVFGFALSIGMIMGSILYPIMNKKIKTPNLLFITFLFIALFLMGCIGLASFKNTKILFYLVLIVMCLVFGMSIAILNATISVLLLKTVDPAYLARISAIFAAVSVCSIPIGSLLVSILATTFSTSAIFIGTGICTLFVIFIMKSKRIFDRIE